MIRTKRLYILLYLLLAIPLLFFRVSNSHDWGDDFAQYLLQSKYLTGEISELPVSATASHGPQVKGVLFSLLLMPVTAFTDHNEISGGKWIVGISLILTGLVLLLLMSRDFGEFNALLLSLIVIYNFQFIRLKDQILPDFLFGALVILAILLFTKKSRKSLMLSLVIAGISTGIKSAGLALVLSASILIILGRHQSLHGKMDKWKALAALIVPVIAIYLIEILLTSQKPSVIWYGIVTAKNTGMPMLAENFSAYKNGLFNFLEFEIPMYLNDVLRWIFIPLFLAGFLYGLFRKPGLTEIFILIYFVFLLFYPYNKDPLRFLIPLLPLIISIMFKMIYIVTNRFQFKAVFTIILVIFSVLTFRTLSIELNRQIHYSTENAATKELLEFLNANIQPDELVADTKPWAISYYSGVRTVPYEAAYLADYRILRIEFNSSFSESVLSGDSVVFKNNEFSVIKNSHN